MLWQIVPLMPLFYGSYTDVIKILFIGDTYMSRKAGTKNKLRGFDSVEAIQLAIDEMLEEKESLNGDITQIKEKISSLKAEQKEKKRGMAKLVRKITKYEGAKAEMEQRGGPNKEVAQPSENL